MNIGTMTATLGVNTAGLQMAEAAMQRFQQKANISMANVTKTLDKTGRNMYYFGTAAGRFLTLPLALAGVAAFKAAKDFESSMQKIVGLVGVAQTQVNEWRQELLKLGPEIGKSPKELAEALYFITSSGFKGAEAMTILTESAKAAASGLGEAKDIADLATSAMSAYKSSGLTASRVMDVLTAAVREGKGEASEYAKQMGDVIPIASKMGVSFDQVASAMSAVSLTGTGVAEASTQIKRILISLLKVTPQAEKALNDMGTSGQEMRDIFRNQGMLEGLIKLNKLFNKFGEDMVGKVFPNVRALLPVLSLTGDRLNDNIKLFKAVDESLGSAKTAYEVTANTIERKYNKALASAQSSMITFGMALKGPIASFLEGFSNKIQSLTNWFSNLTKYQQEWVFQIGVTVAAISPLTIALGLMMRGLSGIAAIVTWLSANPIVIAGAIAATAIAMAAHLIIITNTNKELQTYSEKLEDLGGSTKSFTDMLNKETAQISLLFSTLKVSNNSLNVRKAYVDEINKKYKDYLPNLLSEKTTLNEINEIEAKLIDNIRARMAAQFESKKITAILDQQIERESEMLNYLSSAKVPLAVWVAAFEEAYSNVTKFGRAYAEFFDPEGNKIGEYTKDIDALAKILNIEPKLLTGTYFENMRGKFTPVFDDLIAYRLQDTKAIERTKQAMKEYISLIEESVKTSEKGKGGKGKKEIDYSTMFGNPKEALEWYQKELDKAKYFKFEMPEFEETDYTNFFKKIGDSATPLENLNNQLARIALHNSLVADSFDSTSLASKTLSEQIAFTQQSYDALFELYPMGNELLQIRIDKLKELKEVQEKSNRAAEIGSTVAREFSQALQGNIEDAQDLGNALRRAAINAIAAYIAEAVVYNAKNAITTSKNPYTALIKAAAISAATRALLEGIVPKLAEGGEVPPGYPADTYPALLTSGEIVTPPGKLPSIENQSSSMNGEVVFRIDGYELVGILKKYDQKLSKI